MVGFGSTAGNRSHRWDAKFSVAGTRSSMEKAGEPRVWRARFSAVTEREVRAAMSQLVKPNPAEAAAVEDPMEEAKRKRAERFGVEYVPPAQPAAAEEEAPEEEDPFEAIKRKRAERFGIPYNPPPKSASPYPPPPLPVLGGARYSTG